MDDRQREWRNGNGMTIKVGHWDTIARPAYTRFGERATIGKIRLRSTKTLVAPADKKMRTSPEKELELPLPYPRDAWATTLIHFRGWAARNLHNLTFENLGKFRILVRYAYFTL